MLGEVKHCRQVHGEPRRRWFTNESLDLIVWYNPDNTVYGFQLCYDKGKGERALTWVEGRGYTHRRVDTGEMYGMRTDSVTPVLVPDGHFAAADVAGRFLDSSQELETDLVALVIRHIEKCSLA